MTQGEKQRLFALNIGKLIIWAYGEGYELTFGEAMRSQAQALANAAAGIGIADSLHMRRLAVDLNLYVDSSKDVDDDVYQKDSAAYKSLGDYWKSLHPDNCWGGDFKDKAGKPKPDGNHFSMTDGGLK